MTVRVLGTVGKKTIMNFCFAQSVRACYLLSSGRSMCRPDSEKAKVMTSVKWTDATTALNVMRAAFNEVDVDRRGRLPHEQVSATVCCDVSWASDAVFGQIVIVVQKIYKLNRISRSLKKVEVEVTCMCSQQPTK